MSPIRVSSVTQAQPGFSASHYTANVKAMRAIDVVQSEPWAKREMKKGFTASLQASARIRGGETVALTVVFYRQI
jgi:hypothetical protein